jgi:hypothetical protein
MRLICFGDSWTAGHGIEDEIIYKEEPFPPMFYQKLRDMNSWPRWTAEKLNCPYVNLGVCGYGNEYILKDLKLCVDNGYFKNDDIIIIMFSYPYRYKDKNVYTIIEIYEMMEDLLKNYNHFYFNSFFPTFKHEDYDLTKLPEYFINPNGCVSDLLKDYELKNDISVWEYNSRSVWNDNEKFYEGDYHPNLLGYKIIGEYIYEKIK